MCDVNPYVLYNRTLMKKIVIGLIAVVLIIALYIYKNPGQQNITPASPTPTIFSGNNASAFCTPSDLDATLTSEGAAGNIFGTLSIKNISGKGCQITGNNYILPIFEVQNLVVKNQATKGPETFILSPNQIVYSQIHYPNGPQCSGEITQADITYSYKISPNDNIVFKGADNNAKQSIGVCKSASELTQIDVWSLSEKPVNQ